MEALLSPDQIEALRGVDLHLYFDVHGKRAWSSKAGDVYAGVTDYGFSRITDAVHALDPAKGDTFCTEWITDGQIKLQDVLHTQSTSAERFGLQHAPIVGRDRFSVDNATLLPRTNCYFDPVGTSALLETIRKNRASTTILYAASLAVSKGIRVAITDMERAEYHKYLDELPTLRQEESFFGRFSLSKDVITVGVRNRRMVRRLGEEAVLTRESAGTQEKPVLLSVIGKGHRQGVRHLLRRNEVPFEDVTNTPYDRIFDSTLVGIARDRIRLGNYTHIEE